MHHTVFVTGSTGNVGMEVVKHLQRRGCNVTAAVHSEKKEREFPGVVYKKFDFLDQESWAGCLEGVERVFLVRPPHISRVKRDMFPFLEYLKSRNLSHIVFLSVQGAESNTMIPHNRIEKRIRELGIPHTFLRPSFFMQNLTTTHLDEIRDEGQLFIPSGTGRTNFIDVCDIGEAAAGILLDNELDKKGDRAFTLTGNRSYSYGEVSETLSRILGKTVKHTNPGPLKFLRYHKKKGRKAGMAMVMLALYTIVKRGKGDISTDDTVKLLGRDPVDLDSFIQKNRAVFMGDTK